MCLSHFFKLQFLCLIIFNSRFTVDLVLIVLVPLVIFVLHPISVSCQDKISNFHLVKFLSNCFILFH